MAMVVITTCAAVALTACKDNSSPGTPVPATGTVPATALAASFAPLVHLGADEHNPPMDTSTFIAGSKLVWAQHKPCNDNTVAEHPVEQDLAHGTYHHRASNNVCKDTGPAYTTKDQTRPYSNPDLGAQGFVLTAQDDALHEQGSADASVYVQQVTGTGEHTGKKAYIYWFFYPYNDFPAGPVGDHEGDWERITVATDATDKPVRVVFSHHGKACAAAWQDVVGPDGHPVVYSATGAHGSYPRAGSYAYPTRPDDQTSDDGQPWQTWAHVKAVDQQQWWGYAGGWGKRGADLTVGGHGPLPADDMTGPAGPYPARDMQGEAFTESPCPAPAHTPTTASPTSAAPTTSTNAAPAKTTEGAIQRMEQFLHAVGKGDVKTMCEIAGPAAKKAEDEGMGPCESTFPVTLSMISAAQKAALREATVDPAKVSTHGDQVEVPASAVRAKEKFTSSDLGDFTLEYRGTNWYIVD